jgi:hypothetical protein
MDNSVIHKLEQSAIDAIWIQWRSLGTFIESDRIAKSMVDPEALLLLALTLRHKERRLWDVLVSWAMNGSKLFSVQRVKNLLAGYSEVTKERIAEFAWRAKREGNDFRWENLAGNGPGPTPRSQLLLEGYPAIWEPSALLLQLRLAFGIGIVPDLLGFLLSLNGEWTSARRIAEATGFSVYAIRRTADNMTASHLLESTQAKPMEYRVRPDVWCKLLGIDGTPPPWRFWHQVYDFIANVIAETEIIETSDLSPYILGSRLRDIVEAHGDAFILNRIETPDPNRFPGEQYIHAFNTILSTLSTWIRESV